LIEQLVHDGVPAEVSLLLYNVNIIHIFTIWNYVIATCLVL